MQDFRSATPAAGVMMAVCSLMDCCTEDSRLHYETMEKFDSPNLRQSDRCEAWGPSSSSSLSLHLVNSSPVCVGVLVTSGQPIPIGCVWRDVVAIICMVQCVTGCRTYNLQSINSQTLDTLQSIQDQSQCNELKDQCQFGVTYKTVANWPKRAHFDPNANLL